MTARRALGHLGCLALAWVAPGLVLGAAPPDAAAAGSAAEKLVARYSPTVAFRRQEEPWSRTFGFTTLVVVLVALSGPMLGVGLLLLTDRSLNFINVAGALVYTITVPYAAIALTLYYFDLEARQSGAAPPRHGRPASE
jgi:hypothetical protein